MEFEPVIGLEIHAELETQSKMFCACAVVDSTQADPNSAVCPVCSGMPGVLPVVNQRAVEFALRVALALDCEITPVSIFARKNYFYPDLPKGYQISQYEQPLARNGRLAIWTSQGERTIRIRRVHLEEDTGKLTHLSDDGDAYSLVDLNRSGVPLLEIVSEPDMHSAEEVRAYATALRSIMRYLEVNSGDMQKGVLRIEPNVSVRPLESDVFGVRTEIKNLNSFRALERSVDFEIQRQIGLLEGGEPVMQETRGWDATHGETLPQRSKEEAHDYRYFPEPDLPPLRVDAAWVKRIQDSLPELPAAKKRRFRENYELSDYVADILTAEPAVADYFECTIREVPSASPMVGAHWITGELFRLLNQAGIAISDTRVSPQMLAELIGMVIAREVNQNTAKAVLAEMFSSGQPAKLIVSERGLVQISDLEYISELVKRVLDQNPQQVELYLEGKESLARWLFGQVMRAAQSKADPHIVQGELEMQLKRLKDDHEM